jgi:phosphoglycolate phosphatase
MTGRQQTNGAALSLNGTPRPLNGARPPRAILFDWDNTLIDSWVTIHEARNHLMRAMGQPERSLDQTKADARLSLRESFPLLFGNRWEEAREIYLGHFRPIHLDRLAALPGREAMLRSLAELGIFLGVVSVNDRPACCARSRALGWSGLFIASSGQGTPRRTNRPREFVHLALSESGVPPGEEVWFVGDTALDTVQCAMNSGCVAVLLGEAANPKEFARFAPRLSFTDGASLFCAVGGRESTGWAHLRRRFGGIARFALLRPSRSLRLQEPKLGDYP